MFVICSQPRVGTHMVRTSLNTHPSLDVASEVFNGLVNEQEMEQHSTHQLLAKYPGGFCCHCYDEDETVGMWPCWELAQDLWEMIRRGAVQDVKAVVLWREDKIAQAISYLKASMVGPWHRMKTDPPLDECQTSIDVPPWMLRALFEKFEAATAFQIEVMDGANVERLRISYEQLTESPDHHLHNIQKLFGVQPRPLVPQTTKINRHPIPAQVSNWGDLVRSFRGTKWGHYFDRY